MKQKKKKTQVAAKLSVTFYNTLPNILCGLILPKLRIIIIDI